MSFSTNRVFFGLDFETDINQWPKALSLCNDFFVLVHTPKIQVEKRIAEAGSRTHTNLTVTLDNIIIVKLL